MTSLIDIELRMRAVDIIDRLAQSPFADCVHVVDDRVVLRYQLTPQEIEHGAEWVADLLDDDLRGFSVEYAGRPTIEGGMIVAVLTGAADPIAFEDADD